MLARIKTTIRFKARLQSGDLTGEFGFGLISLGTTPTADAWGGAASKVVGFHCDNDVVSSVTSLAAATENDLSAFVTQSTYQNYEIVYTPGANALFYIDGTLRATHAANLPANAGLIAAISVKNTNGISPFISCVGLEVWSE